MDILQLLGDLKASLESLSSKVLELQTKLADADAALVTEVKAAYDKGFADGKAEGGGQGNGDKIYSQEELDQKIAEQVNPLKDEIAALKLQIEELLANQDKAVEDLKAQLSAAYKAQQEGESAGEATIADLLKPKEV